VSPLYSDEMLALASEIHTDVATLVRSYSADKDRVKAAMEQLEYQEWEIFDSWNSHPQRMV
jgi:hypothetical protein